MSAQDPYRIYKDSRWVDSVMSTLSAEEKIGQLFMAAAFTSKDKIDIPGLRTLVQKYHIGGLIYFRGGPVRQAGLNNLLQGESKVPLLVGMDAEWGLAMRLDSTINFGYQMTMGALMDDSLIYRMGREMARECHRLGVHVSFSPAVDINNNPMNPVIGMRAFGEDKYTVARKSLMYMKGLQDGKVLAVAKHFPGHGDTDVDSHEDLPVVDKTLAQLDTLELYPFRELFKAGVGGVMTAHLNIPALDNTPHTGASLSPAVTTGLLLLKMNYHGLAFSDALNMGGVAKYYKPGELELKALRAGNDVLLYSEDIPKAIEYLKMALDSGTIDQEFIDSKVRKILQVKKWTGLDDCKPTETTNLWADLNTPEARLLKAQINERSITVLKNTNGLIPLKNLQTMRIASIAVGTRSKTAFQNMVERYAPVSTFQAPMLSSDEHWKMLTDTLKYYDVVIISLQYLSNRNTGTFGLSQKAIDWVNAVGKRKTTVLVNFGLPYSMDRFPGFGTVVLGYQDEEGYQVAAAQAVFGGMTAGGTVPVTPSAEFRRNAGLPPFIANRLTYTVPEAVGVSSEKLRKVDSIALDAIGKGAMPGCQILVAKGGKVIHYKGIGNHTYVPGQPVQTTDLYDLASITKVASTTLALMRLTEGGKVKPEALLVDYLPELNGTNKANLTIREVMSHQSGLQAWIPFYKNIRRTSGDADPDSTYKKFPDSAYSMRVADSLFATAALRDSIFRYMNASPVEGRGKYRYSDLGFYYLQAIIERITAMPLDEYVEREFYRPLGLGTLGYNPLERFSRDRIVPTEVDTYFRYQLISGYVHDPGAAMLGGVAGHAGLFGNANDLAIIMQMLLNGGEYGGTRFFKPETVKAFTTAQYRGNRKALGWDRPTDNPAQGPTSRYASALSFGHTGFTGTCVWADPKNGLIYVFLSNRVYPTAGNNLLTELNIRTNIHDAVYRAIGR